MVSPYSTGQFLSIRHSRPVYIGIRRIEFIGRLPPVSRANCFFFDARFERRPCSPPNVLRELDRFLFVSKLRRIIGYPLASGPAVIQVFRLSFFRVPTHLLDGPVSQTWPILTVACLIAPTQTVFAFLKPARSLKTLQRSLYLRPNLIKFWSPPISI